MWWLIKKRRAKTQGSLLNQNAAEQQATTPETPAFTPPAENCLLEERSDSQINLQAAVITIVEESKEEESTLAELPRPLVEPRNPEVKEMVHRQLKELKEARKVARYMVSTEDLVEEKIRKAMERGEFSNLEGKGKPLNLEERPFEDPTMRIPFKILKDAGFAPYWIELSKEIDAEIEGSRMIFEKFLEGLAWRKARKGYIEITPELEQRREEVIETCCQKLENANKKIDLYNCIVPIYWMQRKKVDMKQELAIMKKKWEEMVRY